MTQSTTRSATVESPLSALRRKWWLALILCPLGAALGATVASIGPTKYTVEKRLSVGAGQLTAQAVPGFALAQQELAASYSRWINNTAADVGGEGVDIVSSPIPESAIIRVEGTSTDQEAATKGVNDAADTLVKKVNAAKPGNDPAAVLKQFESAALASAKSQSLVDAAVSNYSSAVGAKRSSASLKSLKTRLDSLRSQQALLDIRRDSLNDKYRRLIADQTTAADLVTVREARVTENDRVAKLQRFGLLGFVLGGLISLLLATYMSRNERRRPARKPAAPPTRRQPAANRRPAPRGAAAASTSGNGAPWAQTRAAAPPQGATDTRAQAEVRTQAEARRSPAPATEDSRRQGGRPRP